MDIVTKLSKFDQQTFITPVEFAEKLGIKILDADGWDNKDINEPITIKEFTERIVFCTLDFEKEYFKEKKNTNTKTRRTKSKIHGTVHSNGNGRRKTAGTSYRSVQ